MHQGRCLQRVTRRLLLHPVRCEPAEFLVDDGKQFLGGNGVALLGRSEDLGDVGHNYKLPKRTLDVEQLRTLLF